MVVEFEMNPGHLKVLVLQLLLGLMVTQYTYFLVQGKTNTDMIEFNVNKQAHSANRYDCSGRMNELVFYPILLESSTCDSYL